MLDAWDVAIFRAIHHGLRQPWLDPIMMWLTDPGPLKYPLLGLIALSFLLLRGKRGAIGLLVLSLTIAAGDQLSSHIVKPLFKRPRPATTMKDVRALFGVRSSKSFPSTHATNFFSAAPVVSAVFPQVTVFAYVYAMAVGLSRIYVGDHYPFDVLGGTALGLFLGFLGRRAYFRLVGTLLGRGLATVPAQGSTSIPMTARGERAPSGGP